MSFPCALLIIDRNVWFTLTVKNNPAIVKKAGILHDQIVQELLQVLNATDFTTQCLFQPVPSFFAQRSVAQGGNVLGLDSVTDNALLWLGTAAVKTAAQEKIVRDKLTTLSKGIEDYANSVGGNIPWRYLNYADSTQDPLKSYGTTNVDFIKKVAAKYDPKAVFQKKVPSGFKISRI